MVHRYYPFVAISGSNGFLGAHASLSDGDRFDGLKCQIGGRPVIYAVNPGRTPLNAVREVV